MKPLRIIYHIKSYVFRPVGTGKQDPYIYLSPSSPPGQRTSSLVRVHALKSYKDYSILRYTPY